MTPDHVEARYLNILATVPPHVQASMNTLREVVDAAQLNQFERGELFRYGVRHRYLTALMLWEPSTAPAAKSRWIRCYRRTTKPVRRVA